MFKAARWRSEKNRITVVFKLQFHATQVSEFGGNGLVLSIVPAENGKPTAKLEKSVVKENNNCYWENPVYETVKFIQDPKTSKIHDRIYYFIISTGSPKGSLVGEISVNIADYVAATKAITVSFPFKSSNSHSHLHVLIQRVQDNGNHRDLEENEGVKNQQPEDRSLRRHFSNGDVEEIVNTNAIEEEPLRKTVSHLPGLNGVRRGSSGSDITLSSTDSSSGLNTPRDLAVRNNNTNRDQTSNGLSYQDQSKMRWDLAIVPVNGPSTEYSMNSPRDAISSERSQMGLDDSVENLKADLIALSRRAEVSEIELQTLRKQIVKESKKSQDLLRDITGLKEERDALKNECEKLKNSQRHADDSRARSKLNYEGDPWSLLEEIREELNYEKDLNANLRLQLQKTQDSNSELIFAVQDLEQILEKNNSGVCDLPNRSGSDESALEVEESMLKCPSDDEEQKALEELVRQHSDAQETYLLEQKIMDLCSEIEMYRRDKDELEMQMEQLALDYEILKQENHEYSSRLEQSHLQDQLKTQYECSSSHATINELEAQKRKLQNELKEQSRELAHYLATIRKLEACNQSLEEEFEKQVEVFKTENEAVTRAQMEQELRAAQAEEALTQSNVIVKELETEIEKLKKELSKHVEELSGSFETIKQLETRNHILEEELGRQAQEYEHDMEAIARAKMEQEKRALQAEEAVRLSDATINELESHIRKLESELKTHSDESSDTLATLKVLEANIQSLEEELEQQAEGFEANLEAVTRVKVEQEQRAIRAEESLRLIRWKNANTAARIQDEFKWLSAQMQSSFEANEKLASKALTEASELRRQNRYLQDMLQKANEELQSAKDVYETKLQELYNQINTQSTQMEQMVLEIEEKSKQLEYQKKHGDELQESVSVQHLEVRAEIERLSCENKLLAEQAKQGEELKSELEQMKAQIKCTTASMSEVAGKSLQDFNALRHLKDEREPVSEVEALRAQCDNLKHSLYEDELEKEKLRKQVFLLKGDIKKKDEAISSIEKKLKENSGEVAIQDKSRATSKSAKSEPVQRGSKEVGAKEVATLKEKIKFLEGQIKSKETSFETSANAFLAKEKNLHEKIQELELRLGELGQSSSVSRQEKVNEGKVSVGMQVDCNAEEAISASSMHKEASMTAENMNDKELIDSEAQTSPDTQPQASVNKSGDQQQFDVLLKEMVLLKERNNAMELELKEMQERYSEISLKFAEVEGERQKLVMSVRYLKNKKS